MSTLRVFGGKTEPINFHPTAGRECQNCRGVFRHGIYCTDDSSADVQARWTQGRVSRDQKFGVTENDLCIASVLTFVASQLDDLVSRSTNILKAVPYGDLSSCLRGTPLSVCVLLSSSKRRYASP